jgi:hypothetical protein
MHRYNKVLVAFSALMRGAVNAAAALPLLVSPLQAQLHQHGGSRHGRWSRAGDQWLQHRGHAHERELASTSRLQQLLMLIRKHAADTDQCDTHILALFESACCAGSGCTLFSGRPHHWAL